LVKHRRGRPGSQQEGPARAAGLGSQSDEGQIDTDVCGRLVRQGKHAQPVLIFPVGEMES
jgi:hypothetical protein